MNFDEAVEYLLSLGHETLAIKLGLRNTELLFNSVSNPEKSFPSVQIAGTNGKGSVAAMLDSICRHAGIRTGLYTSPHLISITERIKINGVEISKEEFARHSTLIRSAAEKLLQEKQIEALPTFFEQVTAIALSAFRSARIDLAILETGLGGRLDSTTAANAKIAGITPIAIDHEEYLGNTLEKIAAEKAAIIRPGVVTLVAAQEKAARKVILERCQQVGVEPGYADCEATVDATRDGCLVASYKTPTHDYDRVSLGLRGRHQVVNGGLAIRLAESLSTIGLNISNEAVIEGLHNIDHHGRLELLTTQRPLILLDGAHNVAGAETLKSYLNEFVTSPVTLIFGAMGDKRVEEIAALLFPLADQLILTEASNIRSASVQRLNAIASEFLPDSKIFVTNSSNEALAKARGITATENLICVSGSLYLIGEIRTELQVGQTTSE